MEEDEWYTEITPDFLKDNDWLKRLLSGRTNAVADETFKVATGNVWREMNDQTTARYLDRLLNMADVIGMQELITVREQAMATKAAEREGMNWFIANENGIAWNPERFKRISSNGYLLSPAIQGERERTASRVVLQDTITSKILCVFNTHLTPQAWTKKPHFRRHWERQVETLGAHIRQSIQHCDGLVLMGDMNGDYRRQAIKTSFRNNLAVGMIQDTSLQGTFGSALYDYIMHNRNGKLKKQTATVRGTASDHDSVIVKYKWSD